MESFSIDGEQSEPQSIDARIAAGDRTAEEELICRFTPRVQAFVASRAAGRDFAEEVIQDTMMALVTLLRQGRLRESDNLPALVYGIARNRLADAIRKHARRRTVSFPENFDCPAPVSELDPELVSSARTHIETLEPVDRRILWMTLIDGFKPAEVASAIGMSIEAVRQRKSRALKKLVDRLKPLSQVGRAQRLKGVSPKS